MPEPLRRAWIAHGPLPVLLAALAPERMATLHPLITAVTDIGPDGDGVGYTVEERVPVLGSLSVPNRYRARLSRPAQDRVVMEAWARGGVHLTHTLDLTPVPEGVAVAHAVEVEAPAWLRGFVARTAQAAHDRWVAAVRAWVAGEAARQACGGDGMAPCDEPYRQGMWRAWGARAGVPWEILANANGAVFLRFPGLARVGEALAPAAAFGPGGLDWKGYARVEAGPLAGWMARGGTDWLAGLPAWAVAALLKSPDATSVADGALWITTRDPAATLDAMWGPRAG